MDDLSQIDEILDTGSLTVGELLLAGLVILITVFIARFVRRSVRGFLESRENVAPHLPELLGRASGWCVILGGIVLALMIIGVQMGPVVLLLLIVVAIFGISGRQVLENFAAGLSLQVTSPFVVGDRIETAGVTGWVQAITGRAVVLTSRDRRTVHIPNSVVLESVLYNYTDDERRRSEVGFAVAYGYNMPHVRQTTVTAVDVLDLVYTDPAPVAYIDELGEDGVKMRMRFYHNDQDRIAARDAVAEAIMTALSNAQIDMPTPEIAIEQTATNEPDQSS